MDEPPRKPWRIHARVRSLAIHLGLHAVPLALALNLLFLAMILLSAGWSTEPIERHVRQAFERGDLSNDDWLEDDPRRGENQYNDCIVLHLILGPANSRLEKTLAPRTYNSDENTYDTCATLGRIVADPSAREKAFGSIYARYWHGYRITTEALLRVFSLRTTRELLRLGVAASLLILAAAAWTPGSRIRTFGIAVASTGLLFWGLPYFGQALSYAPGDALLMIGIALFLTGAFVVDERRLILGAVAFGSIVAFFEFMTGQLPTAASLLFTATYLNCFQRRGSTSTLCWQAAAIAVAAFGVGAVVTVASKQALTAAFAAAKDLRTFSDNLQLYTGWSSPSLSIYPAAVQALLRSSPNLTFHNHTAAKLLLALSTLSWAAAACFAMASKDRTRIHLFTAHLVGASGILLWLLIMPVHAAIHSAWMTRILLVPIALGWSALLSQRRPGDPSARRQELVSGDGSGPTKCKRGARYF